MAVEVQGQGIDEVGIEGVGFTGAQVLAAARGVRFYAGKGGDRLAARPVEVVHDVQAVLGVDLLPNAAHHAVIRRWAREPANESSGPARGG